MSNDNAHKRIDESARRPVAGVIAAAVIVLVLVVGAVSAAVVALKNDGQESAGGVGASTSPTAGDSAGGNDDAEDATPEGETDGAESATSAGETDSGGDADSSTCGVEVESAKAVVKAARTGIRHLKTHVGAHQAWITGAISEEKKSAQYKRTRLLGPGDVDRYKEAVTAYASVKADSGGACDSLAGDCQRQMQALSASLDAAEMGMSHWEAHLNNMAAFAAGKFDATSANKRWDRTRSQMPAMTKPWQEAERALDRAPRCA